VKRIPLSINISETWDLTDCDGDHVYSWTEQPSEQDVAMEILLYVHSTYSPFILAKRERDSVWEFEKGTTEQPAKAYKIFGAENETIPEPIVRGKRKVTLR
jgi:hypothetical protein